MKIAIGLYLLVQLGFLIFAVIASIMGDKRYGTKKGYQSLSGLEKTEEVTVDPHTGKSFRVYYNPSTGERIYQEEP